MRKALAVAFVAVLAAAAGVSTASPTLMRLVLAGLAALVLVALTAVRPQASLIALLAFLPLLGLVRRVAGSGGDNDPLLLIAPMCLGVLLLVALRRGALDRPGRLTLAVLALQVLAIAGVLNPLQGGLRVGVGGLLFVLVPTLWFWVGRSLVDDRTLLTALRVVTVMGLAGAAYGLYQTYAGFPGHDRAWIAANPSYAALSVGDTIRAFGTFTAAAEYASYTGVALVLWCVLSGRRRIAFGVLAVLVLAWALALASSRGIFVLTAAAVAVVLAARLGLKPWAAMLLGVVFLGGLYLAAVQISDRDFGDARTAALLTHQFEGLANPFDEEVSTAGVHTNMVADGLRRATSHPLGVGTGSVTRAAEKYGGNAINTESDFSNSATAFGFPGLVAYVVVVAVGAQRAYRTARTRRDAVSLAIVGVLAVTAMQWLNGGQYALAPLPWLVLGVLDRDDSGAAASRRA